MIKRGLDENGNWIDINDAVRHYKSAKKPLEEISSKDLSDQQWEEHLVKTVEEEIAVIVDKPKDQKITKKKAKRPKKKKEEDIL